MQLDSARVLRARALRSHLDRSAASPAQAADAVVALHGTDPATVHLSVWARMPPAPLREVADRLRSALEQERGIVRVMAMRRTLHLLTRDLGAAAVSLGAERLGKPARKQVADVLRRAGVAAEGEEEAVAERLRDAVLLALDRGDLDADALHEQVPELGARLRLSEGKAYEGSAPVSRYVLHALSVEGAVVRARSAGGWRHQRTTWARADRWWPDLRLPAVAEAHATLARAWLDAFGPGTLDDLAWWAGLPKGLAAAAVAALGEEVVRVEVRGWPGERVATRRWLDEAEPGPHPPSFLPALDPLLMGWKQRAPYLDPAWGPLLFDRSGNGGPTIWAEGKVVGAWASRPDGSIATRILAPGVDERAVARGAVELAEALAGEVVKPRFPVPIASELRGA